LTQPAVAPTHLAFLPHRANATTTPGASVTLSAASMNPGFLTPTGVSRDAALQAIVDRRVLEIGVAKPLHPGIHRFRFALVDLTADPLSPKLAGHEELRQGGLGSMSKVACMFAAFQLRFDMQELARRQGLTSQTALFDAARKIWAATQIRDPSLVTKIFPAKPKIELLGNLMEIDGATVPIPHPFSSPDLEKIFDPASGTTTINFNGAKLVNVDPSVSGVPDINPSIQKYVKKFEHGDLPEVRKFTFAERLFLMVDQSDNSATHSCIENISFLYLASSLFQSDIYSPQRGGGLWEGSTHDGDFRWIKPPVPRGNAKADFVSGTAASAAALFTLMEQKRLVDPVAAAGMRQLTSKNKRPFGSLTRSFFQEGLDAAGLPQIRLHSKLGIGDFLNDGAIIVRQVGSKPIRYVATGFDAVGEKDFGPLIVALDKCIRENNGLLSPSSP
jgi:hypothetical protein